MVTKIEGEIFNDHRGRIASLNDWHLDGVRRTYAIHHPDASVVRGWHGHQDERKWFWCVKGSFTLAFVEIDDWHDPSPDLTPEIFHVSEDKSEIVCVPKGYANCIKAGEPGSILMVFSDKIMEEALLDSWRWPAGKWLDMTRM
ncbi:MAG: WxcM-like domain-containing protein [Muribaculaceae bacterium]|nr:WxcM-like domain-containing protein [Muribaculaceae bacterium]